MSPVHGPRLLVRVHPRVIHPRQLVEQPSASDRIVEWVTRHLGASIPVFWLAFILPLAVLPLSDSWKLALSVISGSWFQWWMLPALQRSQIRADEKRDAKMHTDHVALTHIAHAVDRIDAKMGGDSR